MRLKDKTAIVTGSGAGIGRATAELFAREGAKVVVAELDEKAGRETADIIRKAGGQAAFHRTDVADRKSVAAMVDAAVRAYGTVNVLVNNAAAFVFGKVEDVTEEQWAKVFGVNVIGYANCVAAVLPHMCRAGGGTVVNIASVSSFIAQPSFIPYNASKGAVAQLTRCLAMDLAPDNIRVNGICPGAIRTQATDRHIASLGLDPEKSYKEFGESALIKRMGKPSEIACGALFLACDESSYMTGAHIVIDGGATID
jgi:NAD(P)-dependent dehydrogenase (short-subunit alcohol dehydrogenase family)